MVLSSTVVEVATLFWRTMGLAADINIGGDRLITFGKESFPFLELAGMFSVLLSWERGGRPVFRGCLKWSLSPAFCWQSPSIWRAFVGFTGTIWGSDNRVRSEGTGSCRALWPDIARCAFTGSVWGLDNRVKSEGTGSSRALSPGIARCAFTEFRRVRLRGTLTILIGMSWVRVRSSGSLLFSVATGSWTKFGSTISELASSIKGVVISISSAFRFPFTSRTVLNIGVSFSRKFDDDDATGVWDASHKLICLPVSSQSLSFRECLSS